MELVKTVQSFSEKEGFYFLESRKKAGLLRRKHT